MKHHLLDLRRSIRTTATCLLLPLAATACSDRRDPDTPAPTADAAPAPASPFPAAGRVPAAPEDTPAAIDTGAVSGTYVAGSARLELHGEGTYGLDEAGRVSSGSWSPEAGGTLRLDPGSKGDPDRVYRVDGDRLVPVGGDGPALQRAPQS